MPSRSWKNIVLTSGSSARIPVEPRPSFALEPIVAKPDSGWDNTDRSGVRGNGILCAVCPDLPLPNPYLPVISAKLRVSMFVALYASEMGYDSQPIESGSEAASETDDAEEPGCWSSPLPVDVDRGRVRPPIRSCASSAAVACSLPKGSSSSAAYMSRHSA